MKRAGHHAMKGLRGAPRWRGCREYRTPKPRAPAAVRSVYVPDFDAIAKALDAPPSAEVRAQAEALWLEGLDDLQPRLLG